MFRVKKVTYPVSDELSQIYYYTLNDDDILLTFQTFDRGFYRRGMTGIQTTADNTNFFKI